MSKKRSRVGINEDVSTTNNSAISTRLRLRQSGRIVQIFDRFLHLSRKLFLVSDRQPCRRDRIAAPHLQRAALDVVGVHGQQFVGADQRDWHDVNLRLDGQKKRSWQEWLNLTVIRASAFRENHQRHAGFETLYRRTNRRNGVGWLLLIDANLSGTL